MVNLMGSIRSVMPDRSGWNPQGTIDRGRKVFWCHRLFTRVCTVVVRRADHISPTHTTAGRIASICSASHARFALSVAASKCRAFHHITLSAPLTHGESFAHLDVYDHHLDLIGVGGQPSHRLPITASPHNHATGS